MYQKTFVNGQNRRRPILVRIDGEFISFRYPFDNQLEFYWIPVDNWENSNIREYMKEKEWYSMEMEDFIDACLMHKKIKAPDVTTECIAGFHFHIKWKNDQEGVDHKGNRWINRNNPECTNQQVVDACLDAYNAVKKAFEYAIP